MIFIDLRQLRMLVKRANLDALASAAKVIADFSTDEERKEYIDKNGKLWSAITHELWKLGHRKCWYSEAFILADEGEIEHFRPKKQVWNSAPRHNGYWWRAFDWKNFRLAHPNVNKRKEDYSTETKAGKGCYFPLEIEERRATCIQDECHEVPVLLDPTIKKDCRLIGFDSNTGRPIPKSNKIDNKWQYERALKSIEYYHLDEGSWNAQREDLMRDVGVLCDKIIMAKHNGDESEYELLIDELNDYTGLYSEFNSAAIQVVMDKFPFQILNLY